MGAAWSSRRSIMNRIGYRSYRSNWRRARLAGVGRSCGYGTGQEKLEVRWLRGRCGTSCTVLARQPQPHCNQYMNLVELEVMQ